MKTFLQWAGNRAAGATPQSEPIAGSAQVPNSAGGYAWAVDDWTRLNRFLVLGSEGGSDYATEHTLTAENANALLRCIAADGARVVRMIVEVGGSGRAPRHDPALFALALAVARGDAATRRTALAALPQVARTGTHLFHFAAFVDGERGWGRGLRAAVANWYNSKPARDVGYQALKYQQRDGWGHRDLLRLSHPKAPSESHQILYHWVTQGWDWVGDEPHPNPDLAQVWAYERLKRATMPREVSGLIRDYRLPREAVPTQWLNEAEVWEALLEEMPMTALIRNLATLTRVGLVEPLSEVTGRVVAQVTDAERLTRARLHPLTLLGALLTYAQGHGERGKHTWQPVPAVVDALDRAFYLSFGNVAPTGKRWLLGLDVSGSMASGEVAGMPGLTPRVASAAMALITASVESNCHIMGFSTGFVPLPISPRQRLEDAVKAVSGLPFQGTDCALPMGWALKNKVHADVFVVYTDSETWAGGEHPVQALRRYRDETGIAARLIVVGMVSNGFTIADADDGGMLDVVGFDTATPQWMAEFVGGAL